MGRPGDHAVEETIVRLYATLTEDETLEGAIGTFMKAVGANAGHLVAIGGGHPISIARVGLDDAKEGDYSAYYARIDPWVGAARAARAINRPVATHRHLSDRTLTGSEFFNDFLERRTDHFYAVGGLVAGQGRPLGSVGFLRSRRAGAFAEREEHLLGRILPHVRQVLILRERLNRPPPDVGSLAVLYGMTVAEARVAIAVAGGHTIASYAAARRLSRYTVRNQAHAAMSKAGVRRQADLVRLVLGGSSARDHAGADKRV